MYFSKYIYAIPIPLNHIVVLVPRHSSNFWGKIFIGMVSSMKKYPKLPKVAKPVYVDKLVS